MADKKKLTLSIDSGVIDKAKKLGLNLSEITEKALTMSSFGLDDEVLATPEILREAQINIFRKLAKILNKWDTTLRIGDDQELGAPIFYDYILTPYEVELWASYQDEAPLQSWKFDDEKLPISKFYGPDKIITILIDDLYEKANKNREFLDKLQLLKNIIDLSDLSK